MLLFNCWHAKMEFNFELSKVDKWWGILLRKVAPLLHDNGGPIIMVQVCGSVTCWTPILL